MRRLITILLILIPFVGMAQTYPPIVQGSKLYQFKNGIKVDSAFFLPRRDTGMTDATMKAPGMLLYRNTDSLLYYLKGNTMTPLTIGADGRFVRYTDTAAMLASRWDSTTTKTNFPIDTVATITAMSAYTGKAKVLYVQDTLQGGLFYQKTTGVVNGGTVFSGAGGKYWLRSGLNGVFSVKWWGAKGDYNLTTGTNDAAAITACINYLSSIKTSFFTNTSYRPTLFFPNSNYYLISSPIVIPAGINVMGDGEIVYNGTSASGAITIGTAGEINNRTNITIRLRQRSIPTWVDPQLTSNYGVKIINAQNSIINIPYVIGFCNNIIFEGDNTGGSNGGFSYNDIFIGSSIDAVKHLTLNCIGTTGWVNENKFNAGNFQNSSSTGTRQESRYGIVIRTTSSFIPNNNVFYKPCFQLNYSALPDKVADSTIAIFIEKGNINNFYDIRSENSGPIVMVTKDISFGNYAYTNIFGFDNKDQLVDQSSSRNNYVISDLAKYSGTISGATPIFNSGFLPDRINKYDASTYYVPGTSWARVADANVYPSGGEVGLSNGYITLTENYKMGVFVDTRVAKKFAIKWDVVDEKGGRIFVRLYDKNGVKITPTSSLISPSTLSGNIVSTFGGGYVTGSDNTGRYFNFGVDTSVKSIFVAVSGGTDSLKIKSWQIYSLDNLAASTYSGLRPSFGNFGAASIIPTETKSKGTIIYNDFSSSSSPLGWQNTDGATTWVPIGGITSLNSLTAATQTFATGTTGTDFNISSSTSTHTFNLPTASATNRGALSSADWSTFNAKAPGSGSANYVNISPGSPQSGSFNLVGGGNLQSLVTKAGTAALGSTHFLMQTGGVSRWAGGLRNLETGSNSGSDYYWSGYADDGVTVLGTWLNIARSNGYMSLNSNNFDARLFVNGTFKMTDGTQAVGSFLKGDVNGLSKWVQDYVTPDDYGAVGDGVTNDATALQSAINSGRPVYIPSKTYLINTTVTVPEGTKISGNRTSSILKSTTNNVILQVQGNYVTIQNVKFLGDGKATGKTVQRGISMISNRSKNLIDGCIFSQLGGMGVYVNSIANYKGNMITNCVADSCATGFMFDNQAEYTSVVGCYGYGNTYGIRNFGGNNSFAGGDFSQNDTALVMDQGTGNPGHSSVTGVGLNHNFGASIVIRNVDIGYTFNGAMIYDGKIIIANSVGIKFIGCDFSVDSIKVSGSTNIIFSNNRIRGLDPVLSFDGTSRVYWRDNYNEMTSNLAPETITITATTTLTQANKNVYCNNSTNVTVNLPPAANCTGSIYNIKKVGNNANTIAIDPSGSETIEGSSTPLSIGTYLDGVTIQSNGTGWYVVSRT